MFSSRKKREVKPLSLAVLLSFNELAWIVVGAIVLIFVFFLREYAIATDDKRIRVLPADYQELTNRPVLGTTGMVVSVKSKLLKFGDYAISQSEYQALTNRPVLGPNDLIVTRDYLTSLPVLLPDHRAVPEQQWQDLHDTNFARVPFSNYQELISRPVPIPGMTNVLLSDWNRNIVKNESRIRTELLNLKGPLTNVIILLDASASMNDKGRLAEPRWTEAAEVIATWLKYLPIRRCALVVFSDNCSRTPPNGGFIDMSSDALRDDLVAAIHRIKPAGNTATVLAMSTAYAEYPTADTIILFTDGKPYVPHPGTGARNEGQGNLIQASASRVEMQRAKVLASQHPHLPINIVALGDYFEKEQAEFLLNLTLLTGGSFLGR